MKNVKWLSLVLALVLCLFALPAQAEVQMETHTAVPTIDLPDNDELFAGYVEKQLYADLYGGISTFGTGAYSAGSRLEGTAAFIYEKLAAEVQTIAAAGTGTADTIFSFGSSFNMSDGVKVPDYACTITEEDSSFVVAAMNALIADYPYEMYWFDKGHMGYQCSSAMTESGKPIFVEIYLSVIPAYQNGAQYTVKDSGTLVSNVAKAAQAVVDDNAGKTDMEKLQAYKEYICGAVSYDFDALSSTYGDPWQLIYVFDGDPSTNVVCEGYSKAFQYLCDLSTFTDAVCYTVSGTMAAPDESDVVGAGGHMWNIVRMGGKSYLVDVTNSEYETVGMDGELFMAKATSGNVADGYVVMGYNDTPVTYVYNSAQESLWGEEVLTLAENVPVASITNGSTVTEYTDFAKALEAWTDGTTLTLLDSVSYDSFITLEAGASRIFDGGEHTLALVGELNNEGTLTIKGGTIEGDSFNGVYNFGELTVNGTTINATTFGVYNSGTATIEGCTINAGNQGVYTFDNGTTLISGGTISADNYAVAVNVGKVTITGDVGMTGSEDDFYIDGGTIDLHGCTSANGLTIDADGVATIGHTADATVWLPADHYVFLDGEIVTEMTMGIPGTIGTHTDEDHNFDYTPNADGLTHDMTCTVGCGAGETNAPHTAPDAEGKCVCGTKIVASISNGTDAAVYHTDFAKALEAWTDGTTLTLLDDVSAESSHLISGGTRILDLYGKTWQANGSVLFISDAANVTITDSSPEGKGSLRTSDGSAAIFLEDTSVLKQAAGTVDKVEMMPNGVLSQAQFIMTGGTLTTDNVVSLIAGGRSVTISGGTVEGEIEYRTGVIDLSEHDDPMGILIYTTGELPENPSIKMPEGYALLNRNSGEVVTELETYTDYIVGCDHSKSQHETTTNNGDTHSFTCTVCEKTITEPHTFVDGVCVCNAKAVAQVGSVYYADFAKAVAAWTDGTTLTLLDSVSYDSYFELGAGTRTFVGGEHTLALTGEQARLENYGTLTIASGTITAEAFCVIQNQYSGTLNIEGGTVSTTAVSGAAVVNNSGTLTITGGKVSAMEKNGFAIVNYGDMTLDDGTIEGYSGIGNYGTAELKSGTVTASDLYALYNLGTATLSGANLSTAGAEPAIVCDSGAIIISGGTLTGNGTDVIQRTDGTLTITTTGCNGWKVMSPTKTATIGVDITLPNGYYMFVDDTIVTELEAATTGTIRTHSHNYTATVDEDTDTITYACSCGIGTETAKLIAPEGDLVYNGAAYIPTVELTNSTLEPTVLYTQNGQVVTATADAGTYTATMNWNGKEVSVDFTIAPKPIAATMVEGIRAYNATAEWKVPLILSGVIDGDNVSGGAICTLPSANVGEYTQATINEVLELEGAEAGNYTIAKEDVTFVKATITKAAADKWSVNVAAQEVLVGSGLNAVVVPATGTGIGSEVVQIAQVTFYTDAAMQTLATDADISGLLEGESITLYYVADAKNYESATGSLVLTAIDHQHVWTYTADEDSDTITATCGGTIGNCPTSTVTFKLVPPANAVYDETGKTATYEAVPQAGTGVEPTFTYEALPGNAAVGDNGQPENAGDYKVTMTLGGVSVSGTMSVAPAQIGRPSSYDESGVYTGQAHTPDVRYYLMRQDHDYTLTYSEDMVNAGDKIITVTGMGNYTGTVELPYRITPAPIDAAEITAEAQVYTGEALEPDFTVKLNGKELKHDVDFTFNWSNNVDVGEGKIVITGIGNYEGQDEGTFAITSAPADLTAETYLGETMTGDFTYGDVITIKGAVTVDQRNTFSLRRAPAANEVALYLEGDNEVIAGPVAADPATGEFTLTYDTTNKDIQIGQRNLTLKYVSDGNKQNTTGSLTVTLKQKELTIISAAAAGREYEKDNNLVAVTDVELDGIVGADDVAVTDVQGTLASDNAGTYTTLALPKLELTGSDKDYYSIAADDAVPTDVTISPVVLLTAELPTNVTLDAYLASADQVAAKLPDTITYTDANGDTVELDAAWTCADFDATPKAVNTFAWTVDTTNLTNYVMAAGVDTTGTITVTNTDALPVVITATDDSITFAQQPYDVAGMFDIDANAGDAHYEVVSGDAVLNGTALTVNKVGEIVIRLTTDAHGAYAAAEATATLTVTKADPNVTAPEGLTATYGQTLANVDLPVHGEGTWSWEDNSVRLNKAGPQTYKVVFTPNDTTNWNTLTLDVQVTVDKADPDLAMAVFNGETETYTFTYGETMTVKAMPHLPTILSLRSYTAPAKDQMALFLGDKQISEAVDADENGIYTMTIDTTEKALKIGSNTITAKYTGSDDLNEVQGEATVTLLKRPLGIVNMTAQSRQYEQGNQQVAVTAVELAGKIDGDDVAVATMSAQVSSANVGTYHEAQLPQTVPLTGADADYYEAMGDMLVPVPQLVSITQATPTPTGTGADAGQPAVTPVTEDGKTLADIPLALPEDAYNVPGTIHWVEGDDTPVEEGKEYAWVFIPDDPNYAPVNGTVVIYPAGEAPVITAPTAPQTLNVVEGETGTMTVTATEADAYQWYINRNDGKGYVAIDGATDASYTTSAVKPENDGFTYYCQVSNAYGESKSPVFTLKVKEKVDVPQTGDDAQLGLWLALMVLSLGGMAAMVMNRKRGEN